MPDGYSSERVEAAQSVNTEKNAEMHRKKEQILAFCEEAETQLNMLVKGDSSMTAAEFEQAYVIPLRFTARAINDHKDVPGEVISESHTQFEVLHDFIQHRAKDYPTSDSAEIAIAINHVVGRFHELRK